jgi:hypothetical protein
MRTLAAWLLTLAAVGVISAQPAPAPGYRFDEVRRNVVLTTGTQEVHVDKGQRARGGDRVQTGFFSYALISSEQDRARFEIFASTDVKLADGTPGVILSLDRGRLRAIFDKLTGNEPRVVKTPGALLAVRGTQYDVQVDHSGQTTLDVIEGIVEVRSDLMKQPMLVHAGETSTFSVRQGPVIRPTPPERRPDSTGGHPGDGREGPGQGHDPHGNPPGGPEPRPPGGHGSGGGTPGPPPSGTPPTRP